MRTIRVLDSAPLARRGVVVLELDAPSPLEGIAVGMRAQLVFGDGARERVEVKGLGFASSTPEHAHLIVTAPQRRDYEALERLELEAAG
jgi:hypothetical protein